MTTITQYQARHAADLLDGIVSHPFWKGIDREALNDVINALRGNDDIELELEDDLPDWGIPGDEMVFLNRGGWPNEAARAATVFDVNKRYVISRTSIGRSSSSYRFEGIEHSWNTCMFGYADIDKVRDHWRDHRKDRIAALEDSNEYMGYKLFGDDDD